MTEQTCPTCGGIGEPPTVNLSRGTPYCMCGHHRVVGEPVNADVDTTSTNTESEVFVMPDGTEVTVTTETPMAPDQCWIGPGCPECKRLEEIVEHEKAAALEQGIRAQVRKAEITRLAAANAALVAERDDARAALQIVVEALNNSVDERDALAGQVEAAIPTILREHWPVRIICDHDAKTDQVVCSCSMVTLPVCNSVGEAIETWVQHVVALTPDSKKENSNG